MSAKKTVDETVTETVAETVIDEPAVITEKVVKKPKIKAPEIEPVSVMYVGPSIANVVQNSTVFKDGVLPEAVKKYVESKPYIKRLLIPISELPKAIKELNIEKSALSVIYNKVKNEI